VAAAGEQHQKVVGPQPVRGGGRGRVNVVGGWVVWVRHNRGWQRGGEERSQHKTPPSTVWRDTHARECGGGARCVKVRCVQEQVPTPGGSTTVLLVAQSRGHVPQQPCAVAAVAPPPAANPMPIILYKWRSHSGLPSLTAAALQAEVRVRACGIGASGRRGVSLLRSPPPPRLTASPPHRHPPNQHTGLPAAGQGGVLRAGGQLSVQHADRRVCRRVGCGVHRRPLSACVAEQQCT
jgi:hypothetical protein